MVTPILATLDPELTIRSVDGRPHELVGKSVYALVPTSHHGLLDMARRELFERARLVSHEIPSIEPREGDARWWLVRAAPLLDGRQVVAAIAQAVPRDEWTPPECPPVSAEVWQRELALRELKPILRCLDAELVFSLSRRAWAWEPAE
ncbi:MAG: PAS domain-containing protein [Planctomycetes bacterium]|nr:PAS domain-containing protein [Planctomycetota bacterium]